MERINALIDKLYHQKQQQVTPEQLLVTVQLLQAEILQMQQSAVPVKGSRVAVTMPVNGKFISDHKDIEKNDKITSLPEPAKEEKHTAPPPTSSFYELRKPEMVSTRTATDYAEPALGEERMELPKQMPSPVPAPVTKEIHELIADTKESLNDRLKEEKREVVHSLKDTPIKDLRKGIGINDRFSFLNELFRGDEPMYERSIKTINRFNILSEAEYWISRELKFKLGWDDRNDIVQHFYQLVRRRFS